MGKSTEWIAPNRPCGRKTIYSPGEIRVRVRCAHIPPPSAPAPAPAPTPEKKPSYLDKFKEGLSSKIGQLTGVNIGGGKRDVKINPIKENLLKEENLREEEELKKLKEDKF